MNKVLFLIVLFLFNKTHVKSESNYYMLDSVGPDVIEINSRLELFIDDFLIEKMKGDTKLNLHHPIPREIVMIHDEPWEGSGSGYHSIFKDGDIYKMYYKAWQHTASSDLSNVHPLYCSYAESKDGINWTKPNLGLFEFEGSWNNNIVFISKKMDGINLDAGHPAVFKDQNPNVSKDESFKAILVSGEPNRGLVAFKSHNGINWQLMHKKPIITDGAFDSQNLAFWDPVRKEYRAYWRYFSKEDNENPFQGIRGIRTATSKDFINWTNYTNLKYIDSKEEHLYTNQVKPYYRAPHVFIGFPARYIDRGWSISTTKLPELDEREKRAKIHPRFGTALTESLIMSSRDGESFYKWDEAFLRPGLERNGTWTYGDSYIAWHIVETESSMNNAQKELSIYVTENYWKGHGSALRRYTLRLDGFVSAYASMKGGEIITKPITFSGSSLNLNFSSSAAGDIEVELLDIDGNSIPEFTLRDCDPIFGDAIERKVSWNGNTDLSQLEGKVVKLRFKLKDADLFSFQFKE